MQTITLSASLLAIAFAMSAEEHGTWAISHADQIDKVMFSVERSGPAGHSSNSNSDWSRREFSGVDWSRHDRHDVRFTITRDAGRIECEGFLKDEEGAGYFHFVANAQFVHDMDALGFDGFGDEDKLFAAAIHNVSLDLAKQMKAEKIPGLDTDKLIAFPIFGVTPEFVRAIERLGFPHPDAGKLIALRIHGVTPEYIESMRSKGLQDLTLDKLVSLRIFGVN